MRFFFTIRLRVENLLLTPYRHRHYAMLDFKFKFNTSSDVDRGTACCSLNSIYDTLLQYLHIFFFRMIYLKANTSWYFQICNLRNKIKKYLLLYFKNCKTTLQHSQNFKMIKSRIYINILCFHKIMEYLSTSCTVYYLHFTIIFLLQLCLINQNI